MPAALISDDGADPLACALEGLRLPDANAESMPPPSEELLRLIFDDAPVGMYANDPQRRTTYANARCLALYDLERQSIDESVWLDRVHRDDRERVRRQWHLGFEKRAATTCEFRICHRNGRVIHVHARAKPLLDADGALIAMVGTVDDVTELRLQSAALNTSQRLLARTAKLACVGGWEFDLESQRLVWSDEVCRIHDLPAGHQPTLAEAVAYFPDEGRARIESTLQQAIASGEGFDIEVPMNTASGRSIWVRTMGNPEFVDGRAVRVVGALQDITDRVAQRQALEAAHARMAVANASGGIGIWGCDLQTGIITFDDWVCRAHGIDASEASLCMERWLELVHADDRQAVVAASREAIVSKANYDTEFRVVWADGSIRHLHATARVQYDAAGRALRMDGANWDVTHLRQLSAELSHQHELLRVTLHSIGDAVLTTDARGLITWLNPVAERMTGWSRADAAGRALGDVLLLVDGLSRARLDNAAGGPSQRQAVLVSRDGREYGVEDSSSPIRSEGGAVLGSVLVLHDVTEQRRLATEMSHRASHDALTGLTNRSEFMARLSCLLADAQRDGSEHAVMFIDLDQFKLVNDACGHAVGDRILKQAGHLLAESIRGRDTLARLGGDEFAILLEHCTVEQAQRVAQKICDRMDDFRFVHEDRRFRIGASIGMVPLDSRWAGPTELMQAADTCCYAAKDAGRNRVHTWFDSDQQMRHRRGETNWATRLEQALDERQFVLFGQRIGSACSAISGLYAEVLIRLRDHDGSLIAPGAFLGAAERFGLSARIDRWVLGEVIDRLSDSDRLESIDTLCVNLSGQSVGDRAFHLHARTLLAAAGEAVCRRLCFEITETAAITNLADAAVFIDDVRRLGVRIALDDFGAGASSFGYLKSLKIDLMKIDGQFIKDLLVDPLDDAAVRCFVDVARVVGMKTVAEFVDDPAVLARLREIGIDYAQGYLLHKPEPLANLFAAGGTSRLRSRAVAFAETGIIA